MTDVYHFRYHCEDEDIDVTEWLELTPSQCKNSASHTIDTNTIVIIDQHLDEIQHDDDYAPMARIKYCKTGRHFQCRAMQFVTAKYDSVSEINWDGSAIGHSSLIFYDAEENIISDQGSHASMQDRLDAECCMTDMAWWPSHAYAILGASVEILEEVAASHTMLGWFRGAPDIPKAYLGSIDFCHGGKDFRFMQPKTSFALDGKTAKDVDPEVNPYVTKMQVRLRHSLGLQKTFQMHFFVFQDLGL